MENEMILFEVTVKSGKMEDFADDAITVVTPVRRCTMNERKEAPLDSNQYFAVEA